MQGRIVHLVDLYGYYFLQLLDLLLNLNGLRGLIAETLNKLAHVGHLLLLVLVSPQLLFTTLLAQHHILVVLDFIVDDTATGNLERTIRHVVDKGTVVTDQHHSLRTRRQELLQPLYRLYVQMVGGLVKQQHVRALQQYLCQFDTHAPASRELAGGTFQIGPFEAKSCQRPFYLGLTVLSTHHQITLMLLGKALDKSQIALTLVVRTLSQLLVHLVQPFLQLRHIRKGFLSLSPDGRVVL